MNTKNFLNINVGTIHNTSIIDLVVCFNLIKNKQNNIIFHESNLPNDPRYKLHVKDMNNNVKIYIKVKWKEIKDKILNKKILKHRYYLFSLLKKILGVKKEPEIFNPNWNILPIYKKINDEKSKTLLLWPDNYYYFDNILFNLNEEEIISKLNTIDKINIPFKIFSLPDKFTLFGYLTNNRNNYFGIVSSYHYQLIINIYNKFNISYNEINDFNEIKKNTINLITSNKLINICKTIFDETFKLSKISIQQKIKNFWNDTNGKFKIFLNVDNLLIDRFSINDPILKCLLNYWNLKKIYYIGNEENWWNKILDFFYPNSSIYNYNTFYIIK